MSDILIVDDKSDIRTLLSETLKEEFGSEIITAHNIQSALEALSTNPKVVILDIWLEGSHMDGIGLLKIIKKKLRTTQVIMISGHGNIDIAIKTIKLGAYDFIEKPFKTAKLLIMVERAMEANKLLEENARFKITNSGFRLIGTSKQNIKINQLIDTLAARNNSRIIIDGEAGVGKSTVAKMIHNKSARSDKPFLTWQVLHKTENELLFDMLGSTPNPSIFEYANGGTIFIDEIVGMPLSIQSKFLYLLQSGSIEKSSNKNFDIRFIAATRKDLSHHITIGDLLESLYYNLNIAQIKVPALRERAEDILPLSNYFIEEISREYAVPKKELHPDLIKKMMHYNWPGNIRQLKNSVEWMVMIAENNGVNEIGLEALPTDLLESSNEVNQNQFHIFDEPLKKAKMIFEKQYFDMQLKKFQGNISKAASFIGMDRTALHRKIKELKNK